MALSLYRVRGPSSVPTLLVCYFCLFLFNHWNSWKSTPQPMLWSPHCLLLSKAHPSWLWYLLSFHSNHDVEACWWPFHEQIQCLLSAWVTFLSLYRVVYAPLPRLEILPFPDSHGIVPEYSKISNCCLYVSFACLFKDTSYVYMLCVLPSALMDLICSNCHFTDEEAKAERI